MEASMHGSFDKTKPDVSNWISEAAQAEFVGAGARGRSDAAGQGIRTVKAF
jgi:hypothetical protein